tara:strand:- start:71035 stop:71256 length:222 start_codon:yes stop_codon:yes gene_type:complete
MKFLRLAVDKQANVSLALVQDGSSVFLYRRVNHKQNMSKHYDNVSFALKAFDKQFEDDYSSLGVYYDSLEEMV